MSALCLAYVVASLMTAPHGLTVERLDEPIGLDSVCPRLGWKLPAGTSRQSAYEIEADGWKSGKVISSESVDIPWSGRELMTSDRISWRVRTWDESDAVSPWSAPQTFVMGVMRPEDWRAKWIGPARLTRPEVRPDDELASPAFMRRFTVEGKVVRATLHVTGLGFYEAYLNGVKIGRKVLDPSPTDYSKRVLYSTYVLDGLINPGENELKILVGHGWYDMRSHATWRFNEAPWRSAPKTIAQLELVFADGRVETVVTDGSWDQVESPVVYDDLREGEVRGWRRPGLMRVPHGLKAVEIEGPHVPLVAEAMPGAEVVATIAPERIVRDEDGRWIVSFPETLSGWVRIDFRGLNRGDEVSIRYDENLTPAGGATVTSYRKGHNPKTHGTPDERFIDMFYFGGAATNFVKGVTGMQTDHFVSAGDPVERFEPSFVYHGFRHVIVTGYKGALTREDVRARYVRTAFRETGSFACSDANLTELVRMALNSYKANFTDGIPTDCPHREKLGWTGDAWVASEFAQYFFENTAAYEKWFNDVVDVLKPNGDMSCVAPTAGFGYTWGNGPTFDAVLGQLPWNLWRYRADRRILDVAYPTLVKYLDYLKTIETEPDLVAKGLGDWNARDRSRAPANEYVISCNYLRLREIAMEIARLKGLNDEAETHGAAARRTRAALHRKYYRGNGIYANGVQTAQAMAVIFDLAPESEREAVAAKLVEAAETMDGGEGNFGLMGAKWVYRALAEIGRADVAYKLLVHPGPNSPRKWIGKTGTIWEDWNFGLSKCHVMLGDYAAWAMQYIVGIRSVEPGFKTFVIEPVMISGLDWANGAVETPYGRISVSWRISEGRFALQIDVPPCTVALVRCSGVEEQTVGPGRHTIIGTR